MNFWLGAVLLCAIAITFVLAPWFLRARATHSRREAVIDMAKTRLAEIERDFATGAIGVDDHRQLVLEQQRRLLQEADAPAVATLTRQGRGLLVLFALILPLFASIFYFYSGSWSDWRIQQLLEQSATEVQAGADNRDTLALLRNALERRLAQRDDSDGRRRFMLAQLDIEFRRYDDAVRQFDLLLKQFPNDAGIAAQYAQASYLASGRKLTPEVLSQARRALQLDPNQTTALGLLGIAAFEQKDFAQALLHWRHLLRLLPVDSPSVTMIEQGIKQAEQQVGPDGIPGPKIIVSVSLAAALEKVRPLQGVLFVFAKAVDGPPLPLAVARLDPSRLPIEVVLDNSMAMAAGVDLSSAKQVQVIARITASGQVRGEPGDLEGGSAPLTLTASAQKLALQIDRRL